VTPGEVVNAALELRAEAQSRPPSTVPEMPDLPGTSGSPDSQSNAHHSDAAPPLADEPVAP
jgi:hypothetical protein